MSKRNGNRELGKITDIFLNEEDHGIYTCSVTVEFDDGGGTQGFGGLALDRGKLGNGFVAALCETFGVSNIKKLAGKEYYALRCWGTWNDRIEGLEPIDTGKKFIFSKWRREMGFKGLSPP